MFSALRYHGWDGLALAARDYAAAPGVARLPVICIHGLTRNAADFDELAPAVAAQGRRVLALDVRGRGDSSFDPEPQNYNNLTYAKDVIALTEQLGIERAIFIGTSMGGLITMTLGMQRLNLIAGAVLNDIGPILSTRGLDRIRSYVGKGGALASWDEAAGYVRKINLEAFPDNTDEDWLHWARRAFRTTPEGGFAPRYDPNIAVPISQGKLRPTSFSARWAFKRLARRRPTLLVRGTSSDLLEPEQLAYMRRNAPAMRYAEVPGIGHAPMLTEAPAFDAISDFLATLD